MKTTSLNATFLFWLICLEISAQPFNWAKQLAAGNNDRIISKVVADSQGNTYYVGDFQGTMDFDPGPSTYNLTSNGNSDVFVFKLDNQGNFLWAKHFGSSNIDACHDIFLKDNNIYLTGQFRDSVDFDPNSGTFYLNSNGNSDIFIVKLSISGSFIWARNMGGPSTDWGNGITVDAQNNVISTGYFFQTADFDPGLGAQTLTSAGNRDCFISKLDSMGNFIWVKQLSGNSSINGYKIEVSSNGKLYITGAFSGTVDADPGPSVNNLSALGSADIFVTKLNSNGGFIWAKQIGGQLSYGYIQEMAVDVNDNIYGVGTFSGALDFDPNPSINYVISSNGFEDGFVFKLDSSGAFAWASKIGDTGVDGILDITVDLSSNLYLAGVFEGFVDVDPSPGTLYYNSNGILDAFILKIDATGNLIWAKQFGGSGVDIGRKIGITNTGYFYLVGEFSQTVDFNPGMGSFNMTAQSARDIFIVKMGACEIYYSDSLTSCNPLLSPSGNYLWSTSGTYLDTLISTAGCDSILTVYLTIPTIDTTVSVSGITLMSNDTSANYQWVDCSQNFAPITGANAQTFTPTINGAYAVIIVKQGCSDTSACITINNIGENENDLSAILVYPNPNSGVFLIQLESLSTDGWLEIHSIDGRLVHKQQITGGSLIDVQSKLAKGVYQVMISSPKIIYSARLIIN